MTAYLITWAVLMAAFTWLLVYRRMNLAAAVGVLISTCGVAGGVILSSPILYGSGAVGLVLWLIFWRGGRGGRKRTRREAIGDESRQLRDGLVRRMRRRRVIRRGWSPSPSR